MNIKDKRTYTRATTLLPFEVRRLRTDERYGLSCRISKGTIVIDDSQPPPLEDERLNLWLNMLNTKIDYLINLASPKSEIVVYMTFEPLNISGSGMSLMTKEQFDMGDVLEIRIVLQTYPAKILYLYGEVVRIKATPKKPDTYTLGIKFLGMNEEVRNEIIIFDFKKHRERLTTQRWFSPI
jgi:hypothetical protein